jgi:hypothetical protein
MNLTIDIIHINELIIKYFESEMEKLNIYEFQLKELKKNNTSETISVKTKKMLGQQEEKLAIIVDNIKISRSSFDRKIQGIDKNSS